MRVSKKKKRILLTIVLLVVCMFVKADPIYLVRNWIQYRLDPDTKTALVGTGAAEDYNHNALALPDLGDSYWTNPYDLGHAHIVIPSTIEYESDIYTVTTIGVSAFARTTEVQSVVLPETIKIIESKAFSTCVNLDSILIPNQVETIAESTFESCTNLKYVHLGDGIKQIGGYAFMDCLNLQEINIPAQCESIGNDAFTWCKALSKVIIEDGTRPLSFGYSYNISNNWYQPHFPNNVDGQPHIRGQFADCNLKYIYMGRNITFPQGREWNSIGYNAVYRSFPPFEVCSELDYNNENYYKYHYSPPILNTFVIGNYVTEIPDSLFLSRIINSESFNCMIRDDVIFPNSIQRIGSSSFQWMLNQDVLFIPESVEEIGTGAFENNYLKTVTINGHNLIIEASAFYNNNIEQLTINEGVISIGNSAFLENYVTEISIPESVTSIGNYAFGTNELIEITIPKYVSYLGQHVFANNNLRFVHCLADTPPSETFPFESAVVYVPSGKGSLYRSMWDALIIDPSDDYITINVKTPGSLYSRLLAQDLQLSDVYRLKLKGSINNDDIMMINRMTNLYDWDFSELNMQELPDNLLGNKSFLTYIKLPMNLTKIDAKLFVGCSHLTGTLQIPASCTVVGDSAFYEIGIENLSFDGATIIGKNAFENCYKLENVTFAENIIVGDSAFFASPIKNVRIKRGMSIRTNAFNTLEEAVIEDGTLNLEDKALGRLKRLAFEGTVNSIGEIVCTDEVFANNIQTWLNLPFIGKGPMQPTTRLFFDNNEVVNVIIPENVKTIRPYAFYNCKSLASIQFPVGIKDIKEGAFSNCESLVSVSLPNGIKVIESSTFDNCRSLSTLSLSTSLDSIKNNAFANCENLLSFEMPSKVTYIGEEAFINCNSLTNVSLPLKLVYIGKNAFNGCTGINVIKFQSNIKTIAVGAFSGCTSITELDLPNSISIIEDRAFYDCTGLKTVIVHWQEPFTITNTVFSGYDSDCYLYVPIMTSTKYSLAGWDIFPNLKEGGVMEITGNEGGEILYNDEIIRNSSRSFIFTPYRSFTITINPYEGYYLKKVRVNNDNITSEISNNQFLIEEPDEDIHVTVVFANVNIVDGDANGDGIINTMDAQSIMNHIIKNTPAEFYNYASDLNDDDIINITDAYILISKKVLNNE